MKILALVLVAQLCPTLGDPMDWSQPGSSVHGFSRQESWSGLLFPSPGDLPDPEIQPRSPVLLADILLSEPPWKMCFSGGTSGKEPTCKCRLDVKDVGWIPGLGRLSGKGHWQSVPVFLPAESHGQRSLADCSPWDHKESDMTEAT